MAGEPVGKITPGSRLCSSNSWPSLGSFSAGRALTNSPPVAAFACCRAFRQGIDVILKQFQSNTVSRSCLDRRFGRRTAFSSRTATTLGCPDSRQGSRSVAAWPRLEAPWAPKSLMRKGGLEPPRVLPHRILNPARLPIPPLSRVGETTRGRPPAIAASFGTVKSVSIHCLLRPSPARARRNRMPRSLRGAGPWISPVRPLPAPAT